MALAIDVALLLPDEVIEKAKRGNAILAESGPISFLFDETHLPHISLVHAFINAADAHENGPLYELRYDACLPTTRHKKLLAIVKDVLEQEQFSVTVKNIHPTAGHNGVYMPSFAVEHTEILDALHDDILAAVSSHHHLPDKSAPHTAFWKAPQETEAEHPNEFTVNYVHAFASQYAKDKYFPHITLGVGNKEGVDKLVADKSLNRTFGVTIPRIAVCQLGNFGTCRKILFDIPLLEDDDSPPFVPFKDRPEWADIKPMPQQEGPNPICPIAYSPPFADTMDYFRAVLHKDERSERAFHLTREVIKLNAANYTAWHYRRVLLKALNKDLKRELIFLDRMAMANPKNYQIWYHRKAMIEALKDPSRELAFTARALVGDSKNYHAWAHRQWVLETFKLWEHELVYTDELIKTDFRNNSAWNQRFFVITKTTGWTQAVKAAEIEYAFKFIKSAPNNQSPWLYVKGLVGAEKLGAYNLKESLAHYVTNYPTCYHAQALMVDVLEEEGTPTAYTEAVDACRKLMHNDAIREKYWVGKK